MSVRFEARLLDYTSFILSVIFFITTFLNFFLGLNLKISLLTGFAFIVNVVFNILARRSCCFGFLKISLSLFVLMLLNLGWFLNFKSYGPVLPSFVAYVSFLVFVWKPKQSPILLGIVLLNILLLFALEVSGITEITKYESENVRIMDVYLGVVITTIMIYAFSHYARMKYSEKYHEAKHSDALKTAFLANLSHEIRTPLNAMVGFSGLLAGNTNEKSKKEFAQIIQNNGEHLARLIDDILDISLIESNQLKLSPEKVHLGDFLRSIVVEALNEKDVFNKEQLNIISVNQLTDPVVFIDVVRFRQILTNLISNSIKFSHRGVITIQFTESKTHYTFAVKDMGVGIKEENFKDLFKRFHKIEVGAQKLYGGTGLGLYLSKQLVEKLGGKIGFTSTYSKGSNFFFSIPRHLIATKISSQLTNRQSKNKRA